MPDDKIQPRNQPSGLNIDAEGTKLTENIQFALIAPDKLDLAFYCSFSGWRVVYNPTEEEFMGRTKTKIQISYVVSATARKMNEDCANHLYNELSPLLSAVSITGQAEAIELHKQYDFSVDTLIMELARSFYEGNPYELKSPRDLRDISSMLLRFWLLTSNAKGGFKMKQISEQIITATNITNGHELEKKKGWADKIQDAFKGGS